MGSSGESGIVGKVADKFNSRPVKGALMTGAVAAVAAVLTLAGGGKPPTHCDKKNPLEGVYKHERFKVLDPCITAEGTVMFWRHEHDGDYHVSMVMDDKRDSKGKLWVNPLNVEKQHGYTVVEFVPAGPHIKFRQGQRLKMTGTHVLDLQHGNHHTTGWSEMHPVNEVKVTFMPETATPNNKKLAPPTEEKK